MTTATKTHTGGCHCGAVRFEVELESELGEVMACNCSICSKTAWLLAFVPAAAFRLTKGADSVRDYQFGKKAIHHQFCGTCGIRSFGWGADPEGNKMYSVNMRCVDAFEVEHLKVNHYDGASV